MTNDPFRNPLCPDHRPMRCIDAGGSKLFRVGRIYTARPGPGRLHTILDDFDHFRSFKIDDDGGARWLTGPAFPSPAFALFQATDSITD